ncbi:MAG: hypothetical protein JWN85_4679 [Gammaproteobacteria bacterium]|jgi:uncharacterized protein YndB with AHSA1/START domain|nr:hypothetical protein [Gammaproteobacteria bacterium]
MSSDDRATVRVSHRFNASPERVFDAWIEPAKAGKWLFATATGRIVRTEIDARPGGRFTIVDRRDGEDVEHTGQYLEVERPRRLVFEFSVPRYSREVTRVTIDIVPADGGCLLTLVHEGVFQEYVTRTEGGWKTLLTSLEAHLAQ